MVANPHQHKFKTRTNIIGIGVVFPQTTFVNIQRLPQSGAHTIKIFFMVTNARQGWTKCQRFAGPADLRIFLEISNACCSFRSAAVRFLALKSSPALSIRRSSLLLSFDLVCAAVSGLFQRRCDERSGEASASPVLWISFVSIANLSSLSNCTLSAHPVRKAQPGPFQQGKVRQSALLV